MTDLINDHLRRLMEPSVQEQIRRLTKPRFQEQMRNLFDPSIQNAMRQLAQPSSGLSALRPPSGLPALQEQMRKFAEPSPGMLALQEQVRKFLEQTSNLHVLQEQFSKFAEPSPAVIAFRQQMRSLTASSSMLAIQEQMRTLAERSSSLLSAYNEQMLKVMEPPSYLLAMQEQLQTVAERTASFPTALFVAGLAGRFPTATVFEPLFAERLVNLARAEGELDALLGTSLAIDAVATADEIIVVSPVPGAFLEFLDRLGTVIRLYFEAARSIADLAHLNNVTSLVLTAATLWYVMQAATSEDIDKLRTTVDQQRETVDRQTDAMRQEFKTSRQQFAKKLEELTKTVQQLATSKAATFAPAAVYRVDRAIRVKAERKMKSQTISWLQVGQAVFVVARDKKWVQIEYVNLFTGQSEKGWVVKKYLKRL